VRASRVGSTPRRCAVCFVADRPRLLAITGPTASGKSALAAVLAEALGAVVVSADAMQVYRGMDVGTAKATAEERARVPHFGLDLVDPHEPFDASDFVREVARAVATGRPVIVAGGTSLYLWALRRGLVETPPVDAALRAELEALDAPHAALAEVDPALAARLHPNDRLRVVRGLEVFTQTGRRLSDLQAEHAAAPDVVDLVGIALDRPDLDARIDARARAMFEGGYVEEVERLLARGVSRDAKPMRSLGYRHVADHVIDGLPLDEALARTRRDTRRFARKQRTWLNTLRFPVVDASEAWPVARALAREAFGAEQVAEVPVAAGATER
jgi:tRNA dimethylallyltransferase